MPLSVNIFLGSIYSYIFPQSPSIDFDQFADDFKNMDNDFELSEEILENCSTCLKNNLLSAEEIWHAALQGSATQMDEEHIFMLCEKYPELSFFILLCVVRSKKISNFALEKIIYFFANKTPEQKLELLLTSPQEKKELFPLFIQLADDRNIEIQSLSTFGIMKDLVNQALFLNSEKYLTLFPESYALRIEALRKLVQTSFLSKEEKETLFTLITANERQEERLLLQYLTPQEKERLSEIYSCSQINQLADLIAKGEWIKLFDYYSRDIQLSDLLIAAYGRRKIDLEDLATAMIFHRVFYNTSKNQRNILPITEETLQIMNSLLPEERQQILDKAMTIKSNQKFLILVNQEALDSYTQDLIFQNFFDLKGSKAPGFFHSTSLFGMLSFGAAQAHYKNLAPIIHLTPTIEAMKDHIEQGRSDFALFFPGECTSVHGSQDKTIFPYIHDLFHTHARNLRGSFQKEIMKRVDRLGIGLELREEYSSKMDNGNGSLYPRFITMPNADEMTAYLLDRIIGEVIDGGYVFVKGKAVTSDAIEKVLKTLVFCISNYEFRKLPDIASEGFQKRVMRQVYQRCDIFML
jgi:hypothetical protein